MTWLNRLFGGPQDMAALTAGTNAPDISLAAVDGTTFSLQNALQKGPVLAAFFKVSCPVCQYGFTFPTLLDDPNGYAVSNAYGLTNVPTWFLIGQHGEIEISSVGWVKKEVEDLNRKLAEAQKAPLPPLFKPGEEVRDFRAG